MTGFDSNPPPLTQRLQAEVVSFCTAQFVLGDDLEELELVRAAGGCTSVILTCGRIQEALADAAVEALGLKPSASVAANLEILRQLELVSNVNACWAHALRRMGNEARHILRRLAPIDREIALVFLERWLHWYFLDFAYGKRLPTLTVAGQGLRLTDATELSTFADALGREDIDARRFAELYSGTDSPALKDSPTIAAVLAELLLGQGDYELAAQTLTAALRAQPNDLRLRQLMGLYWSRTGHFDAAIGCLEPLRAERGDDGETIGILAGVYKRMWNRAKAQTNLLARAQRLYRDGWVRSREENAYLGINAATLALFLGNHDTARRLAGQVRSLLLQRLRAVRGRLGDGPVFRNYWDTVTLAEAELILGDEVRAAATYKRAFLEHASRRGDIEVTTGQANRILAVRGVSATLPSLLADAPPTTDAGAILPEA